MQSRREFLGHGLNAFALGMLARSGMAFGGFDPCGNIGATPLHLSGPFEKIPPLPDSTAIGGMPFAKDLTGDWPTDMLHPPFRPIEKPPKATESTDIVVIGGGLSGLATAYLLRERRPIVLEMQPRFGGQARGEWWQGTHYSLGSAYFITPDKGTFLEEFYKELGFDLEHRLSEGDDPVELNGVIRDDFWTGAGLPKDQMALFEQYAEMVAYYGENYPEIPLPDGKDAKFVRDLDRITLKQDIEARLGQAAPALLAAGIQAYCYSSFNAGWEEISAARGWNFVAAEEFGRWVLPGGNAWFVQRLWERLAGLEHSIGGEGCLLRAGCIVHEVRLNSGGALVTYGDTKGNLRSIQAKRVVMCCPKYAAKHMIHGLVDVDNEKFNAMHQINYRPYVVANVLLEAPITRDFYDTFLLYDGNFPTNDGEAEAYSRVVDMLSGHYARPEPAPRSVLTLYWPLPWGTGRFTLLPQSKPLEAYGESLAPQVRRMLELLKVPESAVRQVRMTRWGHAMPFAKPGLIAFGTAEASRRPLEGTVFFVEQDNWALPAVENCLLDAEIFRPEILAGL